MRILTTLLLLCSFVFISLGQNIEVQTLTLDDNSTSGTFQFPDDPTATYEKIWMVYQMRCHEGQVGNGAVGCREWDYSCNTFITDPTRQDSSMATHPTHLIPGFAEDVFDYTSAPTFNYTIYNQVNQVHGLLVSSNAALIGSGTTPLGLNADSDYGKSQMLFLADELTNAGLVAGLIKDIQMEVVEAGTPLNFLKIKMKGTDKTALDPNDPDLDGFTQVYFLNTEFISTGMHQFNFNNFFDWDGTSNILMEISYNSPNSGSDNKVAGDQIDYDGVIYSTGQDQHLIMNGSGEIKYDVSNIQQLSDEVTVAFWSYGNEEVLPSATTILEGLDDNGLRTINIHLPWGNSIVYWDCGSNGGNYDRIQKTASMEDFAGKWNHWAFTKNANTGSMKIYLNGSLWHSATGKTMPIDISEFTFGKSGNGNVHYKGRVDDFQIWKKELDENTIKSWMHRQITNDHPFYSELLSHLTFDDLNGNEVIDAAPSAPQQIYTGYPNISIQRGDNYFKQFLAGAYRPNVTFLQNNYNGSTSNVEMVWDSIPNPAFAVQYFDVNGTDLVMTNTEFLWEAGTQPVVDNSGNVISTVDFPAEGTITIGELDYFAKRDAKYEILSFVTPYGNGLDLGPDGKTYRIDVTDYSPILTGERFLSVEMGGQNQEELDIKFIFVPGTPTRPVMDIQNIWPFARGWFDPILADEVFEPRNIPVPVDADQIKIRSSITGHGQNGEFVARDHYINIDGGPQEFVYSVWKECSENPVYPQGGTWPADRAGWCPGMATDVHEFDITDLVTPGGNYMIDYGVNGATMTEANYLVSNQLVTYGPTSFDLDAELVDIMRPTNRVEHARINPNCDDPIIVIRNSGKTNLTSLEITYGVTNGTFLTHTWNGNLAFLESTEVLLPVDDLNFWSGNTEHTFEVSISAPNGAADEYDNNNSLSSTFEPAERLVYTGLELALRTNLRPLENKLTVTNQSGQVLGTLENLAANTEYIQELDFPAGCYTITLEDSNDDGLYYWFWDFIQQGVGAGSMRLSYLLNNIVQVPFKSFEPDFGGDLHYSFAIPDAVSNKDLTELRKFTLYPNPTSGFFQVELEGIAANEIEVHVLSIDGQLIHHEAAQAHDGKYFGRLDLTNYPAGSYQIRVVSQDRVWVKPLMKL